MPSYAVDIIFQGNRIENQMIMDIGNLKEIWGKGLDEPLVAIEHLKFRSDCVSLLSRDKKPTLKIQLDNGIDLVKFGVTEDEYLKLKDYDESIITVVGTCEVNLYGGKANGQVMIKDYEIERSTRLLF